MLLIPIIIVLIILGIALVMSWKNTLVKLEVQVDEAKSQISTQLQRRFDLIPNLVETVKGYAKHEDSVFEKITKARTATEAATNDPSIQNLTKADTAYRDAKIAIKATAEAYPDLKASQNFLALQEELTTTENKVAFSRQAYNDAVAEFNTAINVYPTKFVSSSYSKKEMFEIESPEVAHAPKVTF